MNREHLTFLVVLLHRHCGQHCNLISRKYVITSVTIKNIYDLDTPSLLVDLDQLERNIRDMADLVANGARALRPHIKTHKTAFIARMQMAAGASGLTVAKLGEAETLADAGFDNLFLANQLVGPLKVTRLLELMERVQIRVAVDSMESATPIGIASNARYLKVPVVLEIDTGLGRAGVRSLGEALTLSRQIAEQPGLTLAGIFTHEGQLYRGINGVDPTVASGVAQMMRTVAEAIRSQGVTCDLVSVGSTPGVPVLINEPGLTEMRPGVYVFNDRMQVSKGIARERCALTVLASVVSVRPDGTAIIDAGSKSMASDSPFEDRTYGEILAHPELTFRGISEEHGHLGFTGAPSLLVGEKVRVIPNHACTCVNLHDTMILHRGEHVEDVVPIECRGKLK